MANISYVLLKNKKYLKKHCCAVKFKQFKSSYNLIVMNRITLRGLLLILVTTSLCHSYAQKQTVPMLSKDEACADVDSLLYTISEVHPNMFSTCRQEELLSLIEHEKTTMADSVSSVELYKRVAPIVAKIGDGHTSLWFPYNQYFSKETKRMPLYMKASTDHKLYVESCLDDQIPYGSEILEINGTSSSDIVAAMLKYGCGEKEFFRIERINNDMKALFELLFKADKYHIVYRLSNKQTHSLTLPTANYDVLIARMPRRQKEESLVPYSFSINKDKTVAIMDFQTFSDPDGMVHFADSMFTVLKENNIKKLIIDIRNNGGGNSKVGDILLSYISPCPYAQMGKTIIRVTPTTNRLSPNHQMPLGWFYYGMPEDQLQTPVSKEQGHFDGKVYLLTSHHTFSSASSFAWAFKYFGMGVVIGEETGGMNVSYGDILSYRMPNSGLQCSISFKCFWLYGADETDIHGTLPDVTVSTDKAMSVALGM